MAQVSQSVSQSVIQSVSQDRRNKPHNKNKKRPCHVPLGAVVGVSSWSSAWRAFLRGWVRGDCGSAAVPVASSWSWVGLWIRELNVARVRGFRMEPSRESDGAMDAMAQRERVDLGLIFAFLLLRGEKKGEKEKERRRERDESRDGWNDARGASTQTRPGARSKKRKGNRGCVTMSSARPEIALFLSVCSPLSRLSLPSRTFSSFLPPFPAFLLFSFSPSPPPSLMSYYPPAQGGYGYPYPPQQQYAAGAPIPGYPVMQQQPPPQQGYYPPQGPPPGSVPIGAPGYSYYPQPQGPPPPMHHAPPPASPYGYPAAGPPPPMMPGVMPVATMPMQAPTSYFAPGTGGVPTPQQDAETIHQACKGFGTDEKRVISVVGKVMGASGVCV